MPTIKGDRSKKAHSSNVKEMMDAYKRTGKIGNTRPRSTKHAEQIANAAAYTSARTTKKRAAVKKQAARRRNARIKAKTRR